MFPPGLALLALEALNERSFLPADVGSGTAVHEQVKVVTGPARVLACGFMVQGGSRFRIQGSGFRVWVHKALTQEAHVIGLLDGQLQVARLVVELTPEVKVGVRNREFMEEQRVEQEQRIYGGTEKL